MRLWTRAFPVFSSFSTVLGKNVLVQKRPSYFSRSSSVLQHCWICHHQDERTEPTATIVCTGGTDSLIKHVQSLLPIRLWLPRCTSSMQAIILLLFLAGITQAQCQAKGCCWNPVNQYVHPHTPHFVISSIRACLHTLNFMHYYALTHTHTPTHFTLAHFALV